MKFRMTFLSLLLCGFSLLGAEDCPDGACVLPGSDGRDVAAVLSPIGRGAVTMIKQAPRLSTLDGKTIAIVGGSFMANVTHPELKRLILKHYPTAKVLVLSEIGSAGPWPGPGVVRQQKDDFVRNLKTLKVDAVISGNGGCGLCTPKEMGSCIAAEYSGLPSVMIAGPAFSKQAELAARIAGVPEPRIAEYPGAFAAHSRETLLENTRNILWPQIITALTTPIKSETQTEKDDVLTGNDIVFTGNFDEVNHFFRENGWSDGLPIVPPTKARVDEFLKYTDLAPDTVVAAIPPSYRQATVRLVAVNGVMAGAPPEFMPILLAFTQAMTSGDFRRTLASTHAWTPYCWINGPIARQLGLESGQGEISSIRNAQIGRFINLAMLNLGGYHIKTNRMGTFGYLMPWCLTEDEAAAVAINWRPYHMQQGFQLNENVLTAASALCWGNNLAPATTNPQKIMEMMAWDAVEKQQFAVGSGTPFVFRSMLITPQVARNLSDTYRSKEALEKALVETARRPAQERAYANYWGNPGSAFNPDTYSVNQHAYKIKRKENAAVTPTPPWLAWSGKQELETVPVMVEGKTAFLVTGDANRNKTQCVPGGGYASVKITLPAKWDELMAEAGYKPLQSFYLKSDLKPSKKPQQFKQYTRPGNSRTGNSRTGNSRPGNSRTGNSRPGNKR